ncbi:MAG: dockerin type I domain-containing protein [Planctomycetota bacterium]|nr:dockerin type I domain-containing protein [Planctomycetota bacterium]
MHLLARTFPQDGVLVYRFQPQVRPYHVLSASAMISTVAAEESLPEVLEPTDVNVDGFTPQIDVLRIIQYLNRREISYRLAEGETDINRMDVTEDGAVSPADVLFVVSAINDRVQADRER